MSSRGLLQFFYFIFYLLSDFLCRFKTFWMIFVLCKSFLNWFKINAWRWSGFWGISVAMNWFFTDRRGWRGSRSRKTDTSIFNNVYGDTSPSSSFRWNCWRKHLIQFNAINGRVIEVNCRPLFIKQEMRRGKFRILGTFIAKKKFRYL